MARGCTRSDASADYIITSNGLPADTAGLTVAGWVKVDASAVTNGGYMCADEVTGGVASFFIRWDVGFGLSLYPFLDDSFAVLTSITEEWLYISISCAGGGTDGMTCRVWDATGQLLVSVTRDLATRSLQKLSIANRIAVNASVLGEYAQWRVWDAALSQSELEAELASSTPVRTANLNRAFEDDPTVDVSGNDRPFGVSGIEVLSSDWPPNYPVTTGTSGGLVVGSETSFVGEGFVGSIESAAGSYTLTAAQGSYSLTGQAAGLRASRILTAAQGSYSLSGQDATLRKSYPLVAAQGSYSLTGQPAGLAVARVITAAQGSYALTGIAANLVYGKTLAAEQGTYSLSGQAAGVRLARVMAASQGSYTLSGQPAGLRATRTLTAAQGAYTLSGQTANLFAARRLTAAQGAYTLTGIAAGLIYSGSGPVLIAGMGGYSLTGQAAALRRSAVLTAAQGAYALDGQPAGLVYGKRMAADAGGYTITGQAATLRTARVLAAATGFYTLDGQPANLVHSGLPFEPEAESATGGWAHYFRAEQAALRRKHLRALAEEAEETREREALAEALETALIADGTATQGDVDRLRLDQIAALYTDRTLLDRRAQRALAYAERSRTELATRLALRELQRQQEDEELAVLLVLAID